jgi:hypothetical protein
VRALILQAADAHLEPGQLTYADAASIAALLLGIAAIAWVLTR